MINEKLSETVRYLGKWRDDPEEGFDTYVISPEAVQERKKKYHEIRGWNDGYAEYLEHKDFETVHAHVEKLFSTAGKHYPFSSHYVVLLVEDETEESGYRGVHTGSIQKRVGGDIRLLG